ncbi:MAG: hypothetical protein IT577_06170 [Verrucomicrobiae bacterium]|nr:hypothetical protein [Verrucomicrobiae bacterium]
MKTGIKWVGLSVLAATPALAFCVGEDSGPSRPLVGAIRWDAWYGTLPPSARPPASVEFPGFDPTRNRKVSQDPGGETQRSLAAEPWRYRWPFFTTLSADGTAQSFNENRPEIIEREIDYAARGGVDYWAFTAYPEASPLSYTLKTFLSCRNRDKIRFSLFVPMWPAYGRLPDVGAERTYWAHLLRMVGQPNYLKVSGNRPVLFMGFFNDALAEKVLAGPWPSFAKEIAACGLGKPYLVFCDGSPKAAKKYCDMFEGDALSAYAKSDGRAKAAPFADLAAHAEAFWASCEETGTPAVPICMTGWDRRTRVMNPVSWESFHLKPDADQYYYRRGTAQEIAAHVGRGVEWFKKHPGQKGAELVLIYAWNEFDEGGWLAPALPPPDGEGAARIEALRKVLGDDK